MGDNVNHPRHYNFGKFEVIDVLQDWFPDNPILWQVVKYIARAAHKNNYVEDLRKARFYLSYEITNRSDTSTDEDDKELVELFHRLWGNAADATEYDKSQWISMQQILNRKGIKV